MFKSKLAKLMALAVFIASLLGILLTADDLSHELGIESGRFITIPLAQDNLALTYDGNCIAKVLAKTESDKLLLFDLQLLDLKTNQELLKTKAYFNPLGQLLASNSLLQQITVVTNGIAELNVVVGSKTYLLTGPITATLDKQAISFEYVYGTRKWDKVFSLFKRLSFVNSTQCGTLGGFQQVIEDFKNAGIN